MQVHLLASCAGKQAHSSELISIRPNSILLDSSFFRSFGDGNAFDQAVSCSRRQDVSRLLDEGGGGRSMRISHMALSFFFTHTFSLSLSLPHFVYRNKHQGVIVLAPHRLVSTYPFLSLSPFPLPLPISHCLSSLSLSLCRVKVVLCTEGP